MPTLKMSDVNNHIKPGTTLITAQPFTFLLSAENRKERCDYCFKMYNLCTNLSKYSKIFGNSIVISHISLICTFFGVNYIGLPRSHCI